MPPFKYDSRLDLRGHSRECPGTWDIPGYSLLVPKFPGVIQEIPHSRIVCVCFSVVTER